MEDISVLYILPVTFKMFQNSVGPFLCRVDNAFMLQDYSQKLQARKLE
jgi:hypothetical protein